MVLPEARTISPGLAPGFRSSFSTAGISAVTRNRRRKLRDRLHRPIMPPPPYRISSSPFHGGLDRETARIEGNARRSAPGASSAAPARPVCSEHDHRRRLGAPIATPSQRAHAELSHPILVEDLAFEFCSAKPSFSLAAARGVIRLAGSFTSSRVIFCDSAMISPRRRAASRLVSPPGTRTRNRSTTLASFLSLL